MFEFPFVFHKPIVIFLSYNYFVKMVMLYLCVYVCVEVCVYFLLLPQSLVVQSELLLWWCSVCAPLYIVGSEGGGGW
jgi:hypothetical protein